MTQMTPIASLHNALFFKANASIILVEGVRVSEYGNPSNMIRAVADNDYQDFYAGKGSGYSTSR